MNPLLINSDADWDDQDEDDTLHDAMASGRLHEDYEAPVAEPGVIDYGPIDNEF